MKVFILIISLLTTLVSCGQKKDKMYTDKVLNDFSRNSYFIVLKTVTEMGTALKLIDNDDLYFYFHEKKGLNKEGYKKFVYSFLNEDKELELTNNDLKKYGFIEVRHDKVVDTDAKKGKDFFLKKYFKNQVIIDGVSEEKKNYIIKVLYDWQIASKIDDETGYLVIAK
jgi:hypothetical protein